jgi:RNA polymerase sigma-70 factor (ECF subfamily)
MCVEDIGPGPSTLTRDRSEHDFLLAALRRIPVDYQIVLELYYWEELRAIAIAEIVELSESTVRTRIRRGRQLLDRAMTELAASPDEYLMIKQDLDKFARSIVWEPTPIEEALPILEESEET